jgi:hypothetical protein
MAFLVEMNRREGLLGELIAPFRADFINLYQNLFDQSGIDRDIMQHWNNFILTWGPAYFSII